METGDVGTLVIAGGALVVSLLALNEAKKATKYQILLNLLSEYRSVEMLHAIRTLWDFYREIKQDFEFGDKSDDNLNRSNIREIKEKLRKEYMNRKKSDEEEINGAEPSKRLEIVKDTLHNQRRIVSKYYQFLAIVYKFRIVKSKTIHASWDERDLRIIPLILLPIDYRLQEEDGNKDPKNHPALVRMKALYKIHSRETCFDD